MKKTIILSVLMIVFSVILTFGQNNTKIPTLQQLESYCKLKSNDDFAIIVKSYGFAFEAKYSQSYGMDYVYVRQTSIQGVIYTERFIYEEFKKDNIVLIQFVTTLKDLGLLYKERIDNLYKRIQCTDTTEYNELKTCYSNKSFYISIKDTRKPLSDGTTGNQYLLKIQPI